MLVPGAATKVTEDLNNPPHQRQVYYVESAVSRGFDKSVGQSTHQIRTDRQLRERAQADSANHRLITGHPYRFVPSFPVVVSSRLVRSKRMEISIMRIGKFTLSPRPAHLIIRTGIALLVTGIAMASHGFVVANAQETDEGTAEIDLSNIDPAVQQAMRLYQQIEWITGPVDANIGTNATIHVPEGYKLTGQAGSQIWNQLTQNPPDQTLATLMPKSEEWITAFSFDNVGYVKDDEKTELDADAIFESMREGTEASNQYRTAQGWDAIHMESWIVEPKYDDATNHLVWAFRLRDDSSGLSANYSMRLLGRRGVMNVLVAAEESKMQEAVDATNTILEGFSYKAGDGYGEFTSGDKVAEYGLTALIAGGGLVAAAKMGLLAKLGKFFKVIVIAVIALCSGIWKLITGRGRSEA